MIKGCLIGGCICLFLSFMIPFAFFMDNLLAGLGGLLIGGAAVKSLKL